MATPVDGEDCPETARQNIKRSLGNHPRDVQYGNKRTRISDPSDAGSHNSEITGPPVMSATNGGVTNYDFPETPNGQTNGVASEYSASQIETQGASEDEADMFPGSQSLPDRLYIGLCTTDQEKVICSRHVQGSVCFFWSDDFGPQRKEFGYDLKGFFCTLLEKLVEGREEEITRCLLKPTADIHVPNSPADIKQQVSNLQLSHGRPYVVEILSRGESPLFLVLDCRLDPEGNIRQTIANVIKNIREADRSEEAQLDYVDEDNFHLSENDATKYQIVERISADPCFYPNQRYISDLLVNRIELIHGNLAVKFNNFEFQIYTPKANMLQEQTYRRLADPEVKCFMPSLYDGPKAQLLKHAQSYVGKYVNAIATRTRHAALQKRAKEEPQTLFVIVADEAHWGITKRPNKKKVGDDSETTSQDNEAVSEAVHDLVVNSWDYKEYPNVIVLLVTATPYNLLTENSRIDLASSCAPTLKGIMEGELKKVVTVHTHYTTRIYSDGKDVTKEMGSIRRLHHVRWAEGHQRMLCQGLVMTLQVPLTRKDGIANSESSLQWLHVPFEEIPQVGETVPWEGADKSSATEVLIKGANTVTISTIDGEWVLTVFEGPTKQTKEPHVGFIRKGEEHLFRQSCTDFDIFFDFGEDVFELRAREQFNHQDVYLKYDAQSREIVTGPKPLEARVIRKEPSLEYCFLIDYSRGQDDLFPGKQYLSLNFYFNSMREADPTRRLIRTDADFADLCNHVKRSKRSVTDDHVLMCEYSFYILLIKSLRECHIEAKTFQQMCRKMDKCLGDYTALKDSRLRTFQDSLKTHGHGRSINVVHEKVFETVLMVLQEEATKRFEKALNDPDDTMLFIPLIEILLFLSADKLKEQGPKLERRHWNRAQFATFKNTFDEDKKEILRNNETCRIVNDVVLSESRPSGPLRGKMKIIRASNIPRGNQMYATLCLARQVASDCYSFEILRDYSTFRIKHIHDGNPSGNLKEDSALFRIRRILQRKQCQHTTPKTFEQCSCPEYKPSGLDTNCLNCGHHHTEINEYTDLDKLPCILILVLKGRMGDTFPPSFNAMDLRLNFVENTPFLTSLVQELGRMCRYMDKTNAADFPYALVGHKLASELENSLNNRAVFCPSDGKIDSYITKNKPNTKHYDYQNTETQKNYILLEAEPQIGKTGVYLCLISKLRQLLTPDEDEDPEVFLTNHDDDTLSETEMFEDDEQFLGCRDQDTDDAPADDLEENWRFPYWKDMKGKPPVLKQELPRGKYSKVYGRYKYGKEPELLMGKGTDTSRKEEQMASVSLPKSGYRAYKSSHSCSYCQTQSDYVSYIVSVAKVSVDVSVPKSRNFQPVFAALDHADVALFHSEEMQGALLGRPPAKDRPVLKSWVFTPTHGRAQRGYLNLHHAMVDTDSQQVCRYVHVLVVRGSQYDIYRRQWGRSHCIICLPDVLPHTDYTVEEGGIGYARRFIQLFAEEFNLSTIFMLDDNIVLIKEVMFHNAGSNQVVKRSRGQLTLEDNPCSLYRVLHQLETQMSQAKNHHPPKTQGKFEGHVGSDSGSLESYTGPEETYGVLGILRHSKFIYKIRKPFRRTHVFGLIHLNVDALKQNGIRYPPWQVFEDCNLNNQCDHKGLLVVKYNRWVSCKVDLPTWLPKVYTWTDKTSLSGLTAHQATRTTKPCSHYLTKWLRVVNPIRKTKEFHSETDSPLRHTGVKDLIKNLQGGLRPSGRSHLVAMLFTTRDDLDFIVHQVANYLWSDTEVQGLDSHLLAFAMEDCLANDIVSKEEVNSIIIQPLFQPGYTFDVITSCNPTEHIPDIVLIRVSGKANGVDRFPENCVSTVETLGESQHTVTSDNDMDTDHHSMSLLSGVAGGSKGQDGDIQTVSQHAVTSYNDMDTDHHSMSLLSGVAGGSKGQDGDIQTVSDLEVSSDSEDHQSDLLLPQDQEDVQTYPTLFRHEGHRPESPDVIFISDDDDSSHFPTAVNEKLQEGTVAMVSEPDSERNSCKPQTEDLPAKSGLIGPSNEPETHSDTLRPTRPFPVGYRGGSDGSFHSIRDRLQSWVREVKFGRTPDNLNGSSGETSQLQVDEDVTGKNVPAKHFTPATAVSNNGSPILVSPIQPLPWQPDGIRMGDMPASHGVLKGIEDIIYEFEHSSDSWVFSDELTDI